jgi:hypothetical protein
MRATVDLPEDVSDHRRDKISVVCVRYSTLGGYTTR